MNFKIISEAVTDSITTKGSDFFSWKNAPTADAAGTFSQIQGWGEAAKTVKLSALEAESIFEQKLNGAYGERFVLSMALIPILIDKGYDVALIQFAKDEDTRFDASGWLVLCIETMPFFHISPDDLSLEDVESEVEVVCEGSARANELSWKQTNKVGEFTALMQAVTSTEKIDFVSVAQTHS
jgi:hypothetical protein